MMKKLISLVIPLLIWASPIRAQTPPHDGSPFVWTFACNDAAGQSTGTWLRASYAGNSACHSTEADGGANEARLLVAMPGWINGLICRIDAAWAATVAVTVRINQRPVTNAALSFVSPGAAGETKWIYTGIDAGVNPGDEVTVMYTETASVDGPQIMCDVVGIRRWPGQ